MSGVYTVVIERDEDGYFVGHAPALPGCHTQAGSIGELMERMTEAITLWLEDETENGKRAEPAGTGRNSEIGCMTKMPRLTGERVVQSFPR